MRQVKGGHRWGDRSLDSDPLHQVQVHNPMAQDYRRVLALDKDRLQVHRIRKRGSWWWRQLDSKSTCHCNNRESACSCHRRSTQSDQLVLHDNVLCKFGQLGKELPEQGFRLVQDGLQVRRPMELGMKLEIQEKVFLELVLALSFQGHLATGKE